MKDLFSTIKEKVKTANKSIVFPEGSDERILTAVDKLAKENVIKPIVIGKQNEIEAKAGKLNLSLGNVEIYDPDTFKDRDMLISALVERRKGKTTEDQARDLLKDENYFGTMLVYTKKADGLVSGAVHSTADTVRPALQIIKTKSGIRKTSGMFVMTRGNEKYIFADCAINVSPDSQDLAEIAKVSAESAKLFDIEPRVALLSFSTKGSADTPETEKVAEAVKIAKEQYPDLVIDGEIQFDAAFVPTVAEKKAPDSEIKGNARVFVFPNLDAGNIGYKITQRLAGFEAVGPILQGLNQPVNDLSRGCDSEDVYNLALITALQAL